jgi:hypothetical protein
LQPIADDMTPLFMNPLQSLYQACSPVVWKRLNFAALRAAEQAGAQRDPRPADPAVQALPGGLQLAQEPELAMAAILDPLVSRASSYDMLCFEFLHQYVMVVHYLKGLSPLDERNEFVCAGHKSPLFWLD